MLILTVPSDQTRSRQGSVPQRAECAFHFAFGDISRRSHFTREAHITTLKLGQRLTVIGQTADWYKAIDSVTGRTGYVSKSFVKKVCAS